MSSSHSPSSRLIEAYAQNSRISQEELSELRRMASIEQRLAPAEDDFYLAVQDRVLAANTIFDLNARMGQILHRLWYEQDGPYEAARETALVENYRRLVEESWEILDDIAWFSGKGREIEDSETYRRNLARASAVLQEEALRKDAIAMMPSLDRLDALADAHLRSIDG